MCRFEMQEAGPAALGFELPGAPEQDPGAGQVQGAQSAALKDDLRFVAALDLLQGTLQHADIAEGPVVSKTDDQSVGLAPIIQVGGHLII